MQTDVLLIGAGPTGLMTAVQLLRNGTRPIIIEKNAGPARETRALGVQARTLEIYQHLGIAEKAIALGHRTQGAHMWVNGRHAARVPLGDIGQGVSPYPFVLILGQDDNEKLLGEVLFYPLRARVASRSNGRPASSRPAPRRTRSPVSSTRRQAAGSQPEKPASPRAHAGSRPIKRVIY